MINNCKNCSLHLTRHNIVVGRGCIPADILFIGEAPGHSEDLLGKAFIGPSGELLDVMRKEAGIFDISSFFTNCIFCHPIKREPTNDEILACSQNLYELISKVNPKFIVLVGDVAQKTFRHEYKHAIKIVHPRFYLRIGGEKAPGFHDQVIKLQQGVNL